MNGNLQLDLYDQQTQYMMVAWRQEGGAEDGNEVNEEDNVKEKYELFRKMHAENVYADYHALMK